jgi:hypothetical protein
MRGKSFSSVFDRDFANMYRTKNSVRRRTFARSDWEISSVLLASNSISPSDEFLVIPVQIVTAFFGT